MASQAGPVLTLQAQQMPMPKSPPRPALHARYEIYAQQRAAAHGPHQYTNALGSITPQSWMQTTPQDLEKLMAIVNMQRVKLLQSIGCPSLERVAAADKAQVKSLRNILVQMITNAQGAKHFVPTPLLEEVPIWQYADEKDHFIRPTFTLSFRTWVGKDAFLARVAKSQIADISVHNNDVVLCPKYGVGSDRIADELVGHFGSGFKGKQCGVRFVFDESMHKDIPLKTMFPDIIEGDMNVLELGSLDQDRLERLHKIFNDALPLERRLDWETFAQMRKA